MILEVSSVDHSRTSDDLIIRVGRYRERVPAYAVVAGARVMLSDEVEKAKARIEERMRRNFERKYAPLWK